MKALTTLAAVSTFWLGTFAFQTAYAEKGEGKPKMEKMEVTGSVMDITGECPNLQFKIGDQTVVTDQRTDFDGECSQLRQGAQVDVEGKLGSDGELLAGEVDLE